MPREGFEKRTRRDTTTQWYECHFCTSRYRSVAAAILCHSGARDPQLEIAAQEGIIPIGGQL